MWGNGNLFCQNGGKRPWKCHTPVHLMHFESCKHHSGKIYYFCQHNKPFDEYIPIESDPNGPGRQMAINWWNTRAKMNWLAVPTSIEDALNHINNGAFKKPQKINVRIDTKHPQILKVYDFA